MRTSSLASWLSLLLIDIIRFGNWNDYSTIDTSSDSYHIYQNFIQLIEDKFVKHHTVTDYTELLGVSQTTLNIYTQQYAQTTPLKLITNRIILEAKRLICYSPLRIKQIAFNLGFDDPSYFIKLFKRNVGMSPAEYKRISIGYIQ